MAKKTRCLHILGAALLLTALFLGCQSDITDATPESNLNQDEDVIVVRGFVRDGDTNDPVPYADVLWVCTSHTPEHSFGWVQAGEDGWYVLTTDEVMTAHIGHTLEGLASEPNYTVNGYNDIQNFHPNNMPYRRDFYIYWE